MQQRLNFQTSLKKTAPKTTTTMMRKKPKVPTEPRRVKVRKRLKLKERTPMKAMNPKPKRTQSPLVRIDSFYSEVVFLSFDK